MFGNKTRRVARGEVIEDYDSTDIDIFVRGIRTGVDIIVDIFRGGSLPRHEQHAVPVEIVHERSITDMSTADLLDEVKRRSLP